ncbi:MAG TPA: DUF72 domain-containing protein [Pyrinomonadaceae bacterium]
MTRLKLPEVKAGCCGLRMQKAEYAMRFPVVEVQQTFYQPPQIKTLERWRAEVPSRFEFTLKAWQLITHEARSPTYKRLKRQLSEAERAECGSFRLSSIVRDAWATTLDCAKALDARRVLFQCPASFGPTVENLSRMRQFFKKVERGGLQFLWEPRGDWPTDVLRQLCSELELVHVVDPFTARTVTPEFCYFRLHGRKGWRHVYEDDELEELLEMLTGAKSAYVLFNNLRMIEDAARFQELVRRRKENDD